jgi:hypothetical protein
MALRDDSWLSLTPEPERLLPEARAALRSGEVPPPAALVAAERLAAARLVLGGRRSRWEAWLRESEALARSHDAALGLGDPLSQASASAKAAAAIAALVREVVANHDALTLGLPDGRRGRGR